jgi:hypothetical protein
MNSVNKTFLSVNKSGFVYYYCLLLLFITVLSRCNIIIHNHYFVFSFIFRTNMRKTCNYLYTLVHGHDDILIQFRRIANECKLASACRVNLSSPSNCSYLYTCLCLSCFHRLFLSYQVPLLCAILLYIYTMK